MLVDPLDEVVGHPSAKAWSADEDSDCLCVFGHVKGGLARRVAAADDDDVAAFQPNRFSGSGAVVDSGANVLLDSRSFKPSVVDAGGGNTGLDFDLRTAGQFD